jgi:hypothetical protein
LWRQRTEPKANYRLRLSFTFFFAFGFSIAGLTLPSAWPCRRLFAFLSWRFGRLFWRHLRLVPYLGVILPRGLRRLPLFLGLGTIRFLWSPNFTLHLMLCWVGDSWYLRLLLNFGLSDLIVSSRRSGLGTSILSLLLLNLTRLTLSALIASGDLGRGPGCFLTA